MWVGHLALMGASPNFKKVPVLCEYRVEGVLRGAQLHRPLVLPGSLQFLLTFPVILFLSYLFLNA